MWLEDGVPYQWVDRPYKFRGHIAVRVKFFAKRGRNVQISDIKWKQLGSETWWRIPEWPKGEV